MATENVAVRYYVADRPYRPGVVPVYWTGR